MGSGWKRSNLWTNKGICPPQLEDNEYRRDLTPNNPGYHHPRTICPQNMMSPFLHVAPAIFADSVLFSVSKIRLTICHFVANIDGYKR